MQPNYNQNLNPYEVPFFYDFALFLKWLNNKSIKRTLTGDISLADISKLLTQFKEQERFEEYKKFGWQIRREEELMFLTQIKLIAEVMFLTYKRKRSILLSKNGRGFLEKLEPIEQYKTMVLHYWYKVNWGYFTPGREVNGRNLAETIQDYQTDIWKVLLLDRLRWRDYKRFCLSLYEQLHLQPFIRDLFDDPHRELMFEIDLILFKRNLLEFGCLEVVYEPSRNDWDKQIVKFRPTPLGLEMFNKAIFENYLI